jgi:AcrR family transcriptional regulator
MDADRRRALLETAAAEFASAGYERASLNRIIRARGISKSSFYHFFGSKEALFDTVVREAAAALSGTLEIPDPEQFAGPDFWPRIERLGEQLLALSEHESWAVDFGKLVYLADAPASASRELHAVFAQVTAWLEKVLTVGRASGAVRDDLPISLQLELTVAVLRALDRWTLTHLDEIGATPAKDLVRLQMDVLKRLLAP